jgi:hypothetical protein
MMRKLYESDLLRQDLENLVAICSHILLSDSTNIPEDEKQFFITWINDLKSRYNEVLTLKFMNDQVKELVHYLKDNYKASTKINNHISISVVRIIAEKELKRYISNYELVLALIESGIKVYYKNDEDKYYIGLKRNSKYMNFQFTGQINNPDK